MPSGELSRDWKNELRSTSKGQTLEDTQDLILGALAAFENEDYERAAFLTEKAKTSAPRSGMVRELLGLSFYHLDKWSDATRELLTYRRLTRRVDQNHVIGDAYRALKRPARAIELSNEVHEKDVSAEVWSESVIVAASAHADVGEFDKALARLAMADLSPRSVEPHHLRLWYVKADLLEKSGRTKEAKDTWEKIAAEDANLFDVADRLRPPA